MPTATETRLLARVSALEDSFNDFAVALDSFVTLTQVNQLVVTLQASVDALQEQVEALEERVQEIENEPLS